MHTVQLDRTDIGANEILVLAIYVDREALERGVEALRSAGFSNADISVLLKPRGAHAAPVSATESRVLEGVSYGVASGFVLGGALGWLAGIGELVALGSGMFIAAGPIMGMLAGLGIGGAIGGLSGALIGLGVPEHEAAHYEAQIKEGGTLLSVRCEDSAAKQHAVDVLLRTAAKNISTTEAPDVESAHSELFPTL